MGLGRYHSRDRLGEFEQRSFKNSHANSSQLLGDAAAGTPLPEFALADASVNSTLSAASALATNASTLVWEGLTQNLTSVGVTGWNVLVDDILRLANTSATSVPMNDLFTTGWENTRHYFRLAVSLAASYKLPIGSERY